jgi:uncharacterized protein (DUF58 family)
LLRGVAMLAAGSVIAFFWTQVLVPLGVMLATLAGAALYDHREARRALSNVSVTRSLPIVVGRNVPFVTALTLTNQGNRAWRGELRDEFPAAATPPLAIQKIELPAGQSARYAQTVTIPVRGRHPFGPVWLRIAGPWGLVEGQRSFECRGHVSILPETFASRERLQKDVGAELRLLDQIQRLRQHGAGTEFESLYPYRPGDDPRRIDWRATARQRTPVVRRFQIERHRDVMLIIDCGRLMGADVGRGSKLDCAVDAALNLARVALQSGDRCGVAAYDRQIRGFLPPIAGRAALRSLVECVYDLQTQWHESDFTPMLAELRARQGKRTFLIVISDLADAETSQRLCASLQQLQRQHLVLFAALRTPLLERTVRAPTSDTQTAARKAVAFRLLRDRRRALHSLSRRGVHVLDVEPQQLAAPLVNQFIELRQRNLL